MFDAMNAREWAARLVRDGAVAAELIAGAEPKSDVVIGAEGASKT
jgi:hypothetical protein